MDRSVNPMKRHNLSGTIGFEYQSHCQPGQAVMAISINAASLEFAFANQV